MVIRSLTLIVLLGISACSKKAELVREGPSTRMSAVWKPGNLTEGTWKAGKSMRNLLSRNLTVVLDAPNLDEEDAAFLSKQYGVDGWLMRVIQSNATASRIELGTLHVPFFAHQMGRSQGLRVRSVSFSLTYAAAAMSERFRRFQCPAFSHNLRLKEYDIQGDAEPKEYVLVPGARFDEKLPKNELVPSTFNVGHSMVGHYTFEVALYNPSEKRLYTPFTKLPFELHVSSERVVEVEGCAGVHEEFEPAPPAQRPAFRLKK